jgi:hypothetical protein
VGIYRKVDVATWSDAKFAALSERAKLLWFYLLTGPQTRPVPGVVVAGPRAMAEELGWSDEAFQKAFGEVLAKGMARASAKDRLVWLPNAYRYNRPESPNVVKGWAKAWPTINECPLKDEIREALKAFVEGLGKAFAEAFRESFPESGAGTGAGTGTGAEEGGKPPLTPRPEPAVPGTGLMSFPCVAGKNSDRTEWHLTAELVETLQAAYPAVDVMAECKVANAWCTTNKSKRKTAGGMERFLNSWMERKQNRAVPGWRAAAQAAGGRESVDERLARIRAERAERNGAA